MNLRERFLARTIVYKSLKAILGQPNSLEYINKRFFDVPDGSRILDLGCGYGDSAYFYADRCSYVGVDANENYINEARRRNSKNKAEFIVGDISDPEVLDRGPYDLVMIVGVLHHLNSDQVIALAKSSQQLIAPHGRLVALENVFTPDQKLSARLMIAVDRGRYVRDSEGYTGLLSKGFTNVEAEVVNGLLRIPYTHVVLTASN